MSKNTIKILIADDHPIFREGIIGIIGKNSSYEIVCSCGEGKEALTKIREFSPDIAILDIDMPGKNGLEIAKDLFGEKNKCRVIILTMFKDEEYFNSAMDCDVMGYLVKDSIANELIECIENVIKGKHYISPAISDYLMIRRDKEKSILEKNPGLLNLTGTEKKVLRLLSENKTSRQIADELFISEKTVWNHRNNISQKLNLKGPHRLLEFAIKNKNLI